MQLHFKLRSFTPFKRWSRSVAVGSLLLFFSLCITQQILHVGAANQSTEPGSFSLAAAGDLDPSFGNGGKVITDVNNQRNEVSDAVLQADGKIVVGGRISNANPADFLLLRYLPNGTLDSAFGNGGVVITDNNGLSDGIGSIAVLANGKILAFGNSTATGVAPTLLLVRYNTDGTLDNTFGTGGKVTASWGNFRSQFGNSLAIQPDGKIVGAGSASDANGPAGFCVIRFNPDGTLDKDFGNDGKVIIPLGGTDISWTSSVQIQSDGKLVLAGMSDRPSTLRDFAVARLNTDGTLDQTFGTGGKVLTDVDRSDGVTDAVIQPDGKIIVFGYSNIGSKYALVRYNTDGSLDNEFGSGGKVVTLVSAGENFSASLILQPDGKILATGSTGVFPTRHFGTVRYKTDGGIDSSFGTNGIVVTPVGVNSLDNPHAIFQQSDGKIVVAGDMTETDGTSSTNFNIAIVRYQNDSPGPTPTPTPTPAVIQLNANSFQFDEAIGSGLVTVTRTGSTASSSSVSYTTSDDPLASQQCSASNGKASSRCDYSTTLGTLSFAAGETSKTILLPIIDDAYAEGSEAFSITLSTPTGATLGTPSTATITINDNDAVNGPNPIDNASFFVRQHYIDFLNREPDADGLAFWTNEITSCGANTQCVEVKRINVSAAFFLSIEFQETGYLVYRMYKAGLGNLPGAPVPVTFTNFLRDTQQIGKGVRVGIGDWQSQLEANKQAFALAFVQRPEFLTAFPDSLTAQQFVDQLNTNAGNVLSPSENAALVALLGATPSDPAKRASVLRSVAEDQTLRDAELNKAFVLMQFFGYLRRNPNDPPDANFNGYDFWLDKLNSFNGNYIEAELVKAFISSIEYRQRFAP